MAREKAHTRALNEGIIKGKNEGINETIINMIKNDIPIETIKKVTGKTIEEIELLKNQASTKN